MKMYPSAPRNRKIKWKGSVYIEEKQEGDQVYRYCWNNWLHSWLYCETAFFWERMEEMEPHGISRQIIVTVLDALENDKMWLKPVGLILVKNFTFQANSERFFPIHVLGYYFQKNTPKINRDVKPFIVNLINFYLNLKITKSICFVIHF